MAHFDALIIGFGKAGKTLAGDLAEGGSKVAMIEKDPMMYGGTCINIACIPTKLLSHDSLAGVEYSQAVERKNNTIPKLRDKNYHNLADNDNITVFDAEARFLNDKEIEIESQNGAVQQLTADDIFINTGAVTALPPIEGVDSDKVFTSTSLIEETVLPHKLTVVGGGYIGLEFATMYNAFGSEVTVIVPENGLLLSEDTEMAEAIQQEMENAGVKFVFGEKAEALEDVSDSEIKVTLSNKDTITSNAVLMATGRKPMTYGLGLENTSIELSEDKSVRVDKHLKTNVDHIWAMGDVKGGMQFTYTSLDDYRVVKSRLADDGAYNMESRAHTHYTMFVDPPYSRIGLTADEAKEEGYDVAEGKVDLSGHPRAHVNNDLRGLSKSVVDKASGKILGAALFGANAEELINLVKLAMDHDLPYTALRDMMYNHPVMSESFNGLFNV
ncbi:FAD-dependent oxidoreductase [Salinicoccus albus]|uniref:FAD-dependent oxidoreductase n=1 Tax=Salinicoccus albus TaxID=418756 RepID=UPI000365919C|nr:FAD-dependent oxidoreductase [Salinicoccus albus]